MNRTVQPSRKLTPQENRWVGAELRPTEEQARFERALSRLRNMTPEQVFQASVDAGVHNADGTLTEHYRGPKT